MYPEGGILGTVHPEFTRVMANRNSLVRASKWPTPRGVVFTGDVHVKQEAERERDPEDL